MDEELLQIRDYDGNGFKPLITYSNWRVGILRYLDDIHPDNNSTMERHTETDEVFVLTRGRGILIIGGNGLEVVGICLQTMEPGKVYNVRRNTWHTVLLSRDASVLIVENHDTGKQNSEFISLSSEIRRQIIETAAREQIDKIPYSGGH
jgi:ureidoglycolate hydrolase